jgi:predicted nucleic acid-binding protein
VRAPLVYIDTNVFIIAFESPLELATPVQKLLLGIREKLLSAVTSELTLAELLAPIVSPQALVPSQRRRLYLDLLTRSRLVELRPVTRDILIQTAELRETTPCKLPDAIHVTTAVQAKCGFFLSKDRRMQVPPGMTQLGPDHSGVDRILAASSQ